jgi:Xaa-Pro dipeptidase
MVADYRGRGKRIGVEYHAYSLTAQRGNILDAAFRRLLRVGGCLRLVRPLRLVKSPAELAYLQQAGRLVDEACEVSQRIMVPGALVGAVYGEMMSTIMRSEGDPTASRWPMGAGEEALLVRDHTPVTARWRRATGCSSRSVAYRHYYAGLMCVILTGVPDPRHRRMFHACAEALDACEAALRPGNTVGEVFETHAEVLTKAGMPATSSMPAAIRWGPPIHRPGWTGRWSMPGSRRC